MKKTHFLLLLAMTFLWLGCRTEDIPLGKSHSYKPSYAQKITFKELKRNLNENGSANLAFAKNSLDIKKLLTFKNFNVDTTYINRLLKGGFTTFSLKAYPLKYTDKDYNINYNVFLYHKDGTWHSDIYKFRVNPDKSLQILPMIASENRNNVTTNSKNTYYCGVEVSYKDVFYCWAGHSSDCSLNNGNCCKDCHSSQMVIVDKICEYINSPDNPIPTGGGGSSSISGFLEPIYPTDISDPNYIRNLNLYDFYNSLTLNQKEWAESNEFTYWNIVYYLLEDYNNRKNFGNWAIGFLAENTVNGVCNVSWEQFQNWFIDNAGSANILFNNNVTNTNSLVFNSLTDFKNVLETKNSNIIISSSIIQDNGIERILSAKVKRTGIWNSGEEIQIKIKKINNIWTFDSVTSSEYGTTLGAWSFTQTSFIKNIVNNILTVEVYGYENYNIFAEGIGTIYKDKVLIRVKINNTNGIITNIEFIDL